jgi:non-specific serine/threonine protein kinase
VTQQSARTTAPAARTAFFGRERERACLAELLGHSPLVTVTGPGGVGKTRLALEIAAALDEDVHWCVLTALTDDASVAPAVAASLGRDSSNRPDAAVVAAVSETPLVLVLDNCEHVVTGVGDLVDRVLDSCPDARVLATSREPLAIDGELVVQLEPLGLPESDDLGAAAASEAVALFADRARLAQWDFELDDDNSAAVARICRRLDGLPLAIELAAARVRSLSPAQIAELLDERFGLLARARSRGAEHQRTLRGTVDWSYRLLEEPEKLVFERLSVFAARADLDAAVAVCGGDGVEPDRVLDVLDRLVERSLVLAEEANGRVRYGMLETLRHYARDKLAEHGGERRARDLHADHYAAVADHARRETAKRWSRDLLVAGVDVFDEARAAIRWAVEHDESHERAFRLLIPLGVLAHSAHATEIATLFGEGLARWPGVHDALGQAVLGAAAGAEFVSGQADLATRHAASAIAAECDDAPPAATARRAVALVTYGFLGEVDAGLERIEEAVQALYAVDAPATVLEMEALRAQALAAAGRIDEALRRAEAARSVAEESGGPYMLAWVLYIQGTVLIAAGDPRAEAAMQESLDRARESDFSLVIGASLRQLGGMAAAAGRDVEAAELLAEACEHFAATGDRSQWWDVLRTAAPLLARHGHRELAAAVLTGAEADARARRPAPLERAAVEQLRAELADEVERSAAPRLKDVSSAVLGELRAMAAGDTAPVAAPEAEVAVLRLEGELWELTWEGQTVHLPDLKGLHDLARLLAEPDRDLHCLDLAGAAGGGSGRAASEDGLGPQGDAGEVLDERARAEYKRRIEELREEAELAQAANDTVRAERAREELDTVTEALASAFGLGGRPRKSGDPAERARSAVTWRIRSALSKVEAAHPGLGRHLRNSVTTGTFCSYRPERPVAWRT